MKRVIKISKEQGVSRRVATLIIAAVCFLVCNAEEVRARQVVDRIVAVVNDDIISLYELNQTMRPFVEKIKSMGYTIEKERQMTFKVRSEMLNQLIDQKLTDQEVASNNLRASEAEIDRAIERFKELKLYTDEDFRAALASQGMTYDNYRAKLRDQILRNKLVNLQVKSKIVITQEDIKTYYDEHMGEFTGEAKYHLRNIIIKDTSMGDEAKRDAIMEKMEAIRTEMQGGADFKELARIHSQSSFAQSGGDLGTFDLADLSEQIKSALQGLQAGDVTPVLETEQGFQIFYIEEIIPSQGKTLEEASDAIQQALYNEVANKKFDAWLEGLRERSHIKIIQ
jgi:peptidyl-prolyl cis-trans isomerase SurA